MYQNIIKRIIDLSGALLLLPFVLIEIIILAPIIWLTDKGPVFYNAIRAGKDYKPFKMFKLRSMYVNSPDIKNADGSTFNSDDDPRVTPVGRILRKCSLDEFPQILNVLKGDMSFIGPRPKLFNPDRQLEEMDDIRRKSYLLKPGITGYAQAFFRNSISNEEKFRLEAYYSENISFALDLKIIIQTVKSVILQKNINTKVSQ